MRANMRRALPPMGFKERKQTRKIPINRYPFTPSTYPGSRPRFSFFFTSKGLYRLKFRALKNILRESGLPSLEARYAVLAYGSNACPCQLSNKELTDVPVLYGRLFGAEAVYAGRITKRGYVPATLARTNGVCSSWITLLTDQQLAVMDDSEGRQHNTYALAKLSNVRFFVGRYEFVPLYTYVNILSGVMTRDSRPISLSHTNQKRAKRFLVDALRETSVNFLDYATIPHPNSPLRYSGILKR